MDKELTCLSQNVNSFNLSTLNKEDFSKSTFHLKLSSLFETKSDIILCQDTRLNNCYDKVISYANLNQFASYTCLLNSTKNSRGVCTFIKRSKNIEILFNSGSLYEDTLLTTIKFEGKIINILNVYGPNSSKPEFFEQLDFILDNNFNVKTIIGGDFNVVPSNNAIRENLDLLNASNIPNSVNSKKLQEIIEKHSLTEIFRYSHPTKKIFSYSPFSNSDYSSRLDFFLVSKQILNSNSKVQYLPKLLKNFDHRPVLLSFFQDTNGKNLPPTISNHKLNIIGTKQIIRLEIINTLNDYLDSKLDEKLLQNANIEILNFTTNLEYWLFSGKKDKLLEQFLCNSLFHLDLALDLLPDFETISKSQFFITSDSLLNTINNNILCKISTFQKKCLKAENCYLKHLELQFNELQKLNDETNLEILSP